MPERILVTYASRTGTTAGVAEAVGATLRAGGAQVDVLPVAAVQDLTSFDAVVVGSAIQSKQWLPEAMQFVQTNRDALRRKPFATFLVCMTLAMKKGDYRSEVGAWLQPVHALVPTVSEGLFAGALDISKVPAWRNRMMFRVSVAMGVWSEGDHRDWDAIRAWTESLGPLLVAP